MFKKASLTVFLVLLSSLFLSAQTTPPTPVADPKKPVTEVPKKPAAAAEKSPHKFMRFKPMGENAGELQTAIATYKDAKGREVILYSAVHIGEASYFSRLQSEFETVDALLYELIAPKGTRPKKNQKSGGIISMFQRGLKRGLQLEFQLEAVDYSPKNFVHADMDPYTFMKVQKERNESMLQLMLRAYISAFKREFSGKGSGMNTASMMQAMSQPDSRSALKLVFAREMENIEGMLAGINDEKGESVILSERNKVCMKVLDEQLELGHKKIGIFYGGAHMPDFDKRLVTRGFKHYKTTFIMAWEIKPSVAKNEDKLSPEEKKNK